MTFDEQDEPEAEKMPNDEGEEDANLLMLGEAGKKKQIVYEIQDDEDISKEKNGRVELQSDREKEKKKKKKEKKDKRARREAAEDAEPVKPKKSKTKDKHEAQSLPPEGSSSDRPKRTAAAKGVQVSHLLFVPYCIPSLIMFTWLSNYPQKRKDAAIENEEESDSSAVRTRTRFRFFFLSTSPMILLLHLGRCQQCCS